MTSPVIVEYYYPPAAVSGNGELAISFASVRELAKRAQAAKASLIERDGDGGGSHVTTEDGRETAPE
jgi:hypothetical protein